MTSMDLTDALRLVTDEEVAHYRVNGWAKLPKLVRPELVASMLEQAKDRMGADATSGTGSASFGAVWNDYYYIARDEKAEPFRTVSMSPATGALVQRFTGRDVGIRYSADMLAVKVPVKPGGGSAPTNWHQDFPNFAHDRVGNFSIWLALNHIPPERGSMRFLSGSQVEGPLGRTLRLGTDLVDIHPWLLDKYDVSPPIDLRPGDATIHHCLMVHHAPQNATNEPRWAYIMSYFPADVMYTGARSPRENAMDLAVDQPFDHAGFPVIYP
jgi:hypothetical protein